MPISMNKHKGTFYPKVLALGFGITLILSLVPLFGLSTGDYRTQWGGNWEDVSLWQTYNGSAWVNATTIPPTPFANTITSGHWLSINSPLQLVGTGTIIINNQLQVRGGSTLDIGPEASLNFNSLRITSEGVIINNGTMTANANSSNLTIEADGTLINNSVIDTAHSPYFTFNLQSAGNLEFGKDGTVTGQGSFSVGWDANISIANPNGVDGCIDLSGSKTYDRANFFFNGNTPQITGITMPAHVLNIVVDNPAGLQLSSDVNVVEEFVVNSGASVDLGLSIINKAWWGVGTFILSPGAGVSTAHPQGISSTGDTGCILVTIRRYDSAADYTFNGTTPQVTGNFVTEPDDDPTDGMVPIANLNISNPSGVTITNPMAVSNNVNVLDGSAAGTVVIVGDESQIDGLFSHNYYHTFAPNGVVIKNYVPQTDTNGNSPLFIKRRWNISGNFVGTKQLTFYWEPEEDNGLDWSLTTPAVVHGNVKIIAEAWDTNASPRWATISITSLDSKGLFYISGAEDHTLPVVLSSFSVLPVQNGGFSLQWTTQSETGVSGYYVWCSSSSNLAEARIVSHLIASTNSSTGATYIYTDYEALNSVDYWYWLQSLDYDGKISYFGPVHAKLETGGGTPAVPYATQLLAPYPNPFNPSVNIAWTMAKTADSEIKIYNQKGQLVRKLFSGSSKSGRNTLIWNGTDDNGKICGSGKYLIVMESAGERFIQKAALVK